MEQHFYLISFLGIVAIFVAAGLYAYIMGRKDRNKNKNNNNGK